MGYAKGQASQRRGMRRHDRLRCRVRRNADDTKDYVCVGFSVCMRLQVSGRQLKLACVCRFQPMLQLQDLQGMLAKTWREEHGETNSKRGERRVEWRSQREPSQRKWSEPHDSDAGKRLRKRRRCSRRRGSEEDKKTNE